MHAPATPTSHSPIIPVQPSTEPLHHHSHFPRDDENGEMNGLKRLGKTEKKKKRKFTVNFALFVLTPFLPSFLSINAYIKHSPGYSPHTDLTQPQLPALTYMIQSVSSSHSLAFFSFSFSTLAFSYIHIFSYPRSLL